MPSTATPGTLQAVIRLVTEAPTPGCEHEEELRAWRADVWSRMLVHLPFDANSFHGQFERSWDSVIEDLHRWCRRFQARPEPFKERYEAVYGHLGLLLVTLVSLRHSYEHRYGATPTPAGHDCAALCVPMLEQSAVRNAIRTVYAPDALIPDVDAGDDEADSTTRDEWGRVDFDSLRFHRHGTTSFILSGLAGETIQGQRRPLALKCIVYPYLRVPTIVRATRDYLSRYGVPSHDVRHLARVWASSTRWILMDFVPGETLAEHLERRLGDPPRSPARAREIRVDLLADLGPELFAAMADLERAGLRHCDLSPSNIIVQRNDPGGYSFVLIDLGINYLYSHAVPGSEGPDSTYVAPEIRASSRETGRADVYSVGQLLVAIAGVSGEPGGSVPDGFYAETPVMARFIEDLSDENPRHRLLIFRPDPAQPIYPQLFGFFEEELAAVAAVRAERPESSRPWLAAVLDLFTPLAGAPGRQFRLWQIRRTQHLYRDPRRGMHVRWLLFWSWLSAAVWSLALTIVVTWWLRDLGWNWGNHLTTLLQRTAGAAEDDFPFLDALRASDYPVPDLPGNLPVRMVGLSFLLAGTRYYQNLFAGLTPLVTGRGQGRLSLLALLAEAHMRLFCVAPYLLVLTPTLIQRDWWPICTAIGVLITFLCNWSCLSFARSALREARAGDVSTVPAGRIAGLEAFSAWTPSAAFYTCVCWSLGTLIYLEVVKDVYVYAGCVAAINTVIFYIMKCSGSSAADVRIGVGRACLAAERLRYVTESPPLIRASPAG